MGDTEMTEDLAEIATATSRLTATVSGLDDATLRQASLLPGWTVAHVLTHIARNADALCLLVTWAETGRVTPMYASADAREADIDAGAARTGSELISDLRASVDRVGVALSRLPAAGEEALGRLVYFGPPRPGATPDAPARSIPFARLREVHIHHLDLGLAMYRPTDWPQAFVARTQAWLDARHGPTNIVGDPGEVLAWRLGRGAGPTVTQPDGSAPDGPPSWM